MLAVLRVVQVQIIDRRLYRSKIDATPCLVKIQHANASRNASQHIRQSDMYLKLCVPSSTDDVGVWHRCNLRQWWKFFVSIPVSILISVSCWFWSSFPVCMELIILLKTGASPICIRISLIYACNIRFNSITDEIASSKMHTSLELSRLTKVLLGNYLEALVVALMATDHVNNRNGIIVRSSSTDSFRECDLSVDRFLAMDSLAGDLPLQLHVPGGISTIKICQCWHSETIENNQQYINMRSDRSLPI